MSTYKTPSKPKTQHDTRTQTMDDFKHVLQILYIGINSELERALQIDGITNTRHIIRMKNDVLNNLEFKKGGKTLPVPRFQIASLRLFIEYCKYKTSANDTVTDFQLLTQFDLDDFTLRAPVTITAPLPGSSIYPPLTSDPAMK